MNRYPRCPKHEKAEEEVLLARSLTGDRAARDLLMWSITGLVIHIAQAVSAAESDNIAQDLWEQVLESMPNIEVRKNVRFISYFGYLHRSARATHIGYERFFADSRGTQLRLAGYRSALFELRKHKRRCCSVAELAYYMNLREERVRELNQIDRPWVSLNDDESWKVAPFVNRTSYTAWKRMPTNRDPLGRVERRLMCEAIDECLSSTLDVRERLVVRFYYGIGAVAKISCTKIGEHLGVNRSRVHQLLQRACKKLRRSAMFETKLREYYNE